MSHRTILSTVLVLFAAQAATAQLAESDFHFGTQGWTVADNGGESIQHIVDYVGVNDADPADLAFVAPASFLGDMSLAYRGSITFELFPTVRPFQPSRPAVELTGGTSGPMGTPLILRRETAAPMTSLHFAPISVTLSDNDAWTVLGEARAPTPDEFRDVLASLLDLRIYADTATASDEFIGLRHVRIDRPRIRVIIGAGQSNMSGCADSRIADWDFTPRSDVIFWNPLNDAFEPLTFGTSDTSCGQNVANQPFFFGPEIGFNNEYENLAKEDLVAFIKFADGGTNLHAHWAPPGQNPSFPNGGVVYNAFIDELDLAFATLDAAGYEYEIDGMLWMQGESDAERVFRADAYESRLIALIAEMRAYTGNPELPFIIARIRETGLGFDAPVRAAQVSVGESDPHACWFDTDDLPKLDQFHYDEPSQIILGTRFAQYLRRMTSPMGDANLDGRVDIEDVHSWHQSPSDINCDGVIDNADREAVVSAVRGE